MTDRQQSEQPVPHHVHGNKHREIEKNPEKHPANIFHVDCSPRNSMPDQPSQQIHHADRRADENAKAQRRRAFREHRASVLDPAIALGRLVRQPNARRVRITDRKIGLSHPALPLMEQPCQRHEPIAKDRGLSWA